MCKQLHNRHKNQNKANHKNKNKTNHNNYRIHRVVQHQKVKK